jgi:CDP-2,3-bis-(O-geranylgeranyl)-sn-glycerol synthase
VEALWIFLPVIGAPLLHVWVLRGDLLRGLKRPLDGGRTFRDRRLLGDNKTWRGALLMTSGVLLATLVLSLWSWWWDRLPAGIHDARPVVYGLLLGLGVVVGELPNSVLKRQLDIAPGSQRSSWSGRAITLLDQGDLVIGIWVCLLPIHVLSVWEALLAFVVISAVHFAINLVGFAVGARTARV